MAALMAYGRSQARDGSSHSCDLRCRCSNAGSFNPTAPARGADLHLHSDLSRCTRVLNPLSHSGNSRRKKCVSLETQAQGRARIITEQHIQRVRSGLSVGRAKKSLSLACYLQICLLIKPIRPPSPPPTAVALNLLSAPPSARINATSSPSPTHVPSAASAPPGAHLVQGDSLRGWLLPPPSSTRLGILRNHHITTGHDYFLDSLLRGEEAPFLQGCMSI